MITFTIFDINGDSNRTLNCDESDLFLNLQAGEKYIVGEYQDHYLVNNQPVQKPPRPSDYYNWDAVGKVWSADLDGARSAMWDKIQIERTRRKECAFPVDFGGKTYYFHGDAESRGQQHGLMAGVNHLLATGKPLTTVLTTVPWVTKGGTNVTMTGELALAIFQTQMRREGEFFSVARAHKGAMEASAEPWNYDYSAGWPKIYGE